MARFPGTNRPADPAATALPAQIGIVRTSLRQECGALLLGRRQRRLIQLLDLPPALSLDLGLSQDVPLHSYESKPWVKPFQIERIARNDRIAASLGADYHVCVGDVRRTRLRE